MKTEIIIWLSLCETRDRHQKKDFTGLKSFMNFLEQATKVYKNKVKLKKNRAVATRTHERTCARPKKMSRLLKKN